MPSRRNPYKDHAWGDIITLSDDMTAEHKKMVVTVLDDMASDPNGQKILNQIRKNNPHGIVIHEVDGNKDTLYNIVDNCMQINFDSAGQTFYYNEEKNVFFKETLNHVIAHELTHAGDAITQAARRLTKIWDGLDKWEGEMVENACEQVKGFTDKQIEELGHKNKFDNKVVKALKAVRDFYGMAEHHLYKMEANAVETASKYVASHGEPARSSAYYFAKHMSDDVLDNLYNDPPEDDIIVLGKGEKYDKKNISDINEDNFQILSDIKEEQIKQSQKENLEKMKNDKDKTVKRYIPGEDPFVKDCFKVIGEVEKRTLPSLLRSKGLVVEEKELLDKISKELNAKNISLEGELLDEFYNIALILSKPGNQIKTNGEEVSNELKKLALIEQKIKSQNNGVDR